MARKQKIEGETVGDIDVRGRDKDGEVVVDGEIAEMHQGIATIPEADVPAAVEEWSEPPVESRTRAEVVSVEVVNPDQVEADRYLDVDTDRMTGKVPHLAERGGAGPEDEPLVMINEQITEVPFYDPGDGIWGGIKIGDKVAYFPAESVTFTPATAVELFRDAALRVWPDDPRYWPPGAGVGTTPPRVPHQSRRAPGEACWAHFGEEFVNLGRMAAEMKLGRGGAAWEEEHGAALDAEAVE